MKIWCARCARYTDQHLHYGRRHQGEWKCGICGNVKKTPRGYMPIGGAFWPKDES